MKYELTIVLPEKATPAKKKAVEETLEKLVKVSKGSIVKKEDLGKINLSYPINKETSSNFSFFELELEPEQVKNLNQKLNLEEEIIRFLLVKSEEKKK